MALLDTRRDQAFPTLTHDQVEMALRFAGGEPRRFEPGQAVFEAGQRDVPLWLIIEGAIAVSGHDGRGTETAIVTETAGQFSGEVAQLGGRASLSTGHAGPEGVTAAPFDAAHLRALLIGSADVGEIVMRALILRRVVLLEQGGVGSILIGRPDAPELVRLQGFLDRNGYPVTVLDTERDEGRDLIRRLGLRAADLPVMLCPNGTVLRAPSDAEAAACLGISPDLDPGTLYDVAVVGAGPAGLASAVYAASEGLSVLVVDQRAYGGQAGASARIENYLGFPTGISGRALAARAFIQAQKFGAQVALPIEAVGLDCHGPELGVRTDTGVRLRARTVVVASGARYRRLAIPDLEAFEGHGVSYWASAVEARLCTDQVVALVGAGNSAGQAVVFLAPKVERLYLVVRGKGLEASMSAYLVERIAALPNVELLTETEVTALDGHRATGLAGATLIHRPSGETRRLELRHLFVFVGADPNSDWLGDCVALDGKGFVVTGDGGARPALPLETSRAGVFAIGDVRAGSTKRVSAAVGEGAAVVAQIHSYLASASEVAAATTR